MLEMVSCWQPNEMKLLNFIIHFPFQLSNFFLELGRFRGVGRGSVVQGVSGAAARQRHREVGRRLRVVRAEHLHRHEAGPLVGECARPRVQTQLKRFCTG